MCSVVTYLHCFIIVYLRCFAEWADFFTFFLGNVTVKARDAYAEIFLNKLVIRFVSLIVNIVIECTNVLLMKFCQTVLSPILEARRFVCFVLCANCR